MLFPYIYVPHQMEKMHAFIDFIFHEVWCKAPTGVDYSLDLFVANPELHEVMTAFHYDDSNGAEFFSGHVERIYGFSRFYLSRRSASFSSGINVIMTLRKCAPMIQQHNSPVTVT